MVHVRSPNKENIEKRIIVGYAYLYTEEIKNMEKMRFEQFTEEVVRKIREFLPDSFANASVELQSVVKNNDLKLTGLTIRSTGSNICPTIYLEQFYEEYQSGKDMSRILSQIADLRVRNEVNKLFDVTQITDFEQVKDAVAPRLMSKKWNENLLESRPHKLIADLAVTYHIMLKQDINGTASVPVTNDLMKTWGVDADTLHKLALRNMPKLIPSTFQSMSEVLSDMLGENVDAEDILAGVSSQDDVMFVLSNKKKMYGASALLDKKIMQKIIDKFESFYILPSSVHECLIVKATADMDVDTLTAMVHDVNTGQVEVEDRLSDHVYKYTVEEGLISA